MSLSNHWCGPRAVAEIHRITFTDDTTLEGSVDFMEDREVLRRDPDRLQCWAVTSCVKFNKAKCQILYLRLGNPGYTYRLGKEGLEPHGKGFGGLG